MCDVVAELDAANEKIQNLETHVQRLEKEKRGQNQGRLLCILCKDKLYLCY